MTMPIQIASRIIEHSGRIEAKVRQEAAKLEKFYSPIESCRVIVEAPEHRRRHGELHHVRIDLGVPGGKLVVKREPSLHRSIQDEGQKTTNQVGVDGPHKHFEVAIRDAFPSARRQLQDYARRQRGYVKIHETVEVFPEKEDGLLETAHGHQIYFHKNTVLEAAFGRIKAGSTVAFAEEQADHSPQASTEINATTGRRERHSHETISSLSESN